MTRVSALDAVLTDKTILLEPHMTPLVGKDAIGKRHDAFDAARASGYASCSRRVRWAPPWATSPTRLL